MADDACHFECFSLAPGVSSIASYQKKLKTNMKPRGIVLASTSPPSKGFTRKAAFTLKFFHLASTSRERGENAKIWLSGSAEKAKSVHAEDDCLVIAADTVVNLNEKVLGSLPQRKMVFDVKRVVRQSS